MCDRVWLQWLNLCRDPVIRSTMWVLRLSKKIKLCIQGSELPHHLHQHTASGNKKLGRFGSHAVACDPLYVVLPVSPSEPICGGSYMKCYKTYNPHYKVYRPIGLQTKNCSQRPAYTLYDQDTLSVDICHRSQHIYHSKYWHLRGFVLKDSWCLTCLIIHTCMRFARQTCFSYYCLRPQPCQGVYWANAWASWAQAQATSEVLLAFSWGPFDNKSENGIPYS